MRINGTLFWYYTICKRQVWFMARNITGEQENSFLVLGRMIHENSYQRDKKEIVVGNIKIDVLKKKGGDIVIGEIKKSSKSLNSAIEQLKFYLWKLDKMGLQMNGRIFIPSEKKNIDISLTEDDKQRIPKICANIQKLIELEIPPPEERLSY